MRSLVEKLCDHLSGFYYDKGMAYDAQGKPLFKPVARHEDGARDKDWKPTQSQLRRRERSHALLAPSISAAL